MKKLLSIILLIVICSSAFAQPFKTIKELSFKKAYIDSLLYIKFLQGTSTGYSIVVYDSASQTLRQVPASTFSTGCFDSAIIQATDYHLPFNGNSLYYLGGDSTLHLLPVAGNYHLPFNNDATYYLAGDSALHKLNSAALLDSTLFPVYVDSTTQAYQQILVAGRDGKISSDSMFRYNFAQNKVVINAKTSAKFGSAIKLYVNGGTVINGIIARENGKANQFLKADGSLDTNHYVKSVKVNGTTFNVDTTTGNVDLGTIGGGTGSVTSFSKTDNYGIISSVTNPTTTPNHAIAVDSATLSAYYLRRKDSAVSYTTIKRLADTAATKNFLLGWYNVVDYGADTTGVTDATSAIQAAINDAAAHGGGTVYFRKGTYKIAGAYKTSDGNGHGMASAQLYIPYSSYSPSSALLHIRLLGENATNGYANFGDSIPNPKNGVILKSTATSSGSIIGSPFASSVFGNFSYSELDMENITVRARSKTAAGADTSNIQTGINALNIAMFRANNVRVDNESVDSSSLQPATGSYGIKLPGTNNFVLVHLTNTVIHGYYTGIQVNEHLEADGVFVSTCFNGVEFTTANHAVNFTKLLIEWCANNLLISGTSYVTIANLDVEDFLGTGTGSYSSRWFNSLRDIYEPTLTNSYFNIYTHRVVSGAGAADAGFTASVLSPNVIYSQIGKPFPKFFSDLSVTSPSGASTDYTGTFSSGALFNGIAINSTNGGAGANAFVTFQKNGTDLWQINSNINKKAFGILDFKTSKYRYWADSLGYVYMSDAAADASSASGVPFTLRGKSVGLNSMIPGATLDVISSGNHTGSSVDTIAKFTGSSTYGIVALNSSTTNGQTNIAFQKQGVSKWHLVNDFSANGTSDFGIYDVTNTKLKMRINAGIVYLGNDANTSPNLTIADGAAGSVTFAGKAVFQATNTAAGTTGAQTINKASGSVNFAAGATSLVVTNSLVTTASHIIPIVETNDASAFSVRVVPAAGSFTIFLVGTAPAAETKVGFVVTD